MNDNELTEVELLHARFNGYRAKVQDINLEDNPWQTDNLLHEYWKNGWLMADQDFKEMFDRIMGY